MPEASISRQFAERLSAFRFRDLPPEVALHAKLALLDTLGAMLVASSPRYPAGRLIMGLVQSGRGRGWGWTR